MEEEQQQQQQETKKSTQTNYRREYTPQEKAEYQKKKQEEQNKQREDQRIQKLIVCVCEQDSSQYKDNIEKLVTQINEYVEKGNQEYIQKIIKLFPQSIAYISNKQAIYGIVITLLANHQNSQLQSQICVPIMDNLLVIFKETLEKNNQLVDQIKSQYQDYLAMALLQVFSEFLELTKQKWISHFKVVRDIISNRKSISNLLFNASGQEMSNYPIYFDILSMYSSRLEQTLDSEKCELLGFYDIQKLFEEELKLDSPYVFQADFASLVTDLQFQQARLICVYSELLNLKTRFQPSVKMEQEGGVEILQEQQKIEQIVPVEYEYIDEISNGLERIYHFYNIINILEEYMSNRQILLQKLQIYNENQFQIPESILRKIIVEAFMTKIFQVPSQNIQQCILFSTLSQYSIQKEDIKIYVAEYINELCASDFQILKSCDLEFIDNLASFLSIFISNTNTELNWQVFISKKEKPEENIEQEEGEEGEEKDDSGEEGPLVIQYYFLRKLLKEMRLLISSTRVNDMIPEELHKFLPKAKEELYRLENENEEDFEYIMQKLNEKTPAEDILTFLKSEDDGFQQNFELFFEALLKKMTPTQTHLSVLFDRYKLVFEDAHENLENFSSFLGNKILNFWFGSEFHIIKYLEKFFENKLISCEQIKDCLIDKITNSLQSEELIVRYFRVLMEVLNWLENDSEEKKKITQTVIEQISLILKEKQDEQNKHNVIYQYYVIISRKYYNLIKEQEAIQNSINKFNYELLDSLNMLSNQLILK